MRLGDGCQTVGGVRCLLNGSKLVQLIGAFSCPTLAEIFDLSTQLRNSLAMDLGELSLGDNTRSLEYSESIAPLKLSCCLMAHVTTSRQLCSAAKLRNSSIWVARSGEMQRTF
jgi:hypothetical protein